ncbi:MAG TPA: chemotaxis response regulator protein-glutamate methylesterase [Clostridiales bacterium]|nr:MAG: chemotaxis response regulator protein-glutamate methylesterase [Clostridiales bacterium GWD2_32_59]HAN10274.1 chemotaxis response regulator protein-glutamate methylesterase [Clostridiales bacterium]
MTSYNKKIKVLVVDDSMLFRETIKKGISNDQYIQVVGVAGDPYIARDMILELEPDVLTLDIEMPRMNGIEFLKKLLPQYPIPVIVVSAVSDNVFNVLASGAVDFVAKPDVSKVEHLNKFFNELIMKIKIASVSKIKNIKQEYSKPTFETTIKNSNKFIAVGASTGGTEAFYSVLKTLPKDAPGIVVVQHMPPVFTRMYAERLDKACDMEVKEAEDKDIIKRGRVLIAPGGYHMSVYKDKENYYVKCFIGENVNGHSPSVDVMFESIAKIGAKDAIGVILTGMGSDGAKGLLNMRKNGSYTIGQDEKTSVVYGMPMVAYNIGAVIKQVPLDKISEAIYSQINV